MNERGQTSGSAPTHPLQVSFARGSRGTTLGKDGETTITIPDHIITSAKHDMYRHGGITPTLHVCGTRKTVSILMPEAENRNGRAEQLIRIATQLAHARTVGEIDLVVLMTQAWA